MAEPLKFLVDDTLRGLSRKLRMIGFDCLDRNKSSWWAAFARATREQRVIITLLRTLRQPPDVTVWFLETATSNEQVIEVLSRLLPGSPAPEPFSRCLVCNDLLAEIPANDARKSVPPMVAKQQSIFHQCPSCYRIYWKGSHYHKMVSWMKRWHISEKLGLPPEQS